MRPHSTDTVLRVRLKHVPGQLAYGLAGAPSAGIDAHADLIFSFELVEVR